MMVYEDSVYVYGGYVRSKDLEDNDLEHGKTLDDMWKFDLKTYKV